ncbi:hypothetical protein B0H21DRAFT_711644 [Amylocystis lapponica]|nr:hypothetical protein B0H21DRAFT_711644 [Amylocystis lapponica]
MRGHSIDNGTTCAAKPGLLSESDSDYGLRDVLDIDPALVPALDLRARHARANRAGRHLGYPGGTYDSLRGGRVKVGEVGKPEELRRSERREAVERSGRLQGARKASVELEDLEKLEWRQLQAVSQATRSHHGPVPSRLPGARRPHPLHNAPPALGVLPVSPMAKAPSPSGSPGPLSILSSHGDDYEQELVHPPADKLNPSIHQRAHILCASPSSTSSLRRTQWIPPSGVSTRRQISEQSFSRVVEGSKYLMLPAFRERFPAIPFGLESNEHWDIRKSKKSKPKRCRGEFAFFASDAGGYSGFAAVEANAGSPTNTLPRRRMEGFSQPAIQIQDAYRARADALPAVDELTAVERELKAAQLCDYLAGIGTMREQTGCIMLSMRSSIWYYMGMDRVCDSGSCIYRVIHFTA